MAGDEEREGLGPCAVVLAALEREQPRFVTADLLGEIARREGVTMSGRSLSTQLRRLGWLQALPRPIGGVWELSPVARTVDFPTDDRYTDLRAVLAASWRFAGAVAMESAAALLGLTDQVPERDVLALPPGTSAPPGLRHWQIVQLSLPGDATTSIDGLPVWRVEALLVGIASLPSTYREWPNVAEWLHRAVARADLDRIHSLLARSGPPVRQRTGYLLARGGRPNDGLALLAGRRTHNTWMGPRDRPPKYDSRFRVLDTVLPSRHEDRNAGNQRIAELLHDIVEDASASGAMADRNGMVTELFRQIARTTSY